MPLFISLVKFTQQGFASIEESPNRLDAAKKELKERGGEIKDFYLTMGRYDAVAIIEAPYDKTIARFTLRSASLGNVKTEVLRAFDEEDYRRIISDL